MTNDQLQTFRELLLKQLRELETISENNREASDVVELDQSRQGRLSRMDALQGQAMSMAAKQRRQHSLALIKEALTRIDQEEYGFCDNCGEEIAVRRLQFDPTATLCISCAEKNETR